MGRRKRMVEPKPRKYAFPVISVDPMVYAEAIRIAAGDGRRLEIIDAKTVIVHNNRNYRKG